MAFKNKNFIVNSPNFTHFANIPFIRQQHRLFIDQLQQKFRQSLHSLQKFSSNQLLRQHNHKLCHLTLFKLILKQAQLKQKLKQILMSFENDINDLMLKIPIGVKNINYFTRFNKNSKCKEITVIYLQIEEQIEEIWIKLVDKMLRALLKEEVLVASQLKQMNVVYDHKSNLYRPETLHISLFRARNLLQDQQFLIFFQQFRSQFQPFKWKSQSFHISTMLQYDENEFYMPFYKQLARAQNIQQEVQ